MGRTSTRTRNLATGETPDDNEREHVVSQRNDEDRTVNQVDSFEEEDEEDEEDKEDEEYEGDEMDSIVGSDDEQLTAYTKDVQDMLTVYERKIRVKASTGTRADILKLVRRVVLPFEKFTSEGTSIGTFERPDFTNQAGWPYIVLKKAGFKDKDPRSMAKIWNTYRKDVSDVFSNHRSNVSVRMKKAFLAGE